MSLIRSSFDDGNKLNGDVSDSQPLIDVRLKGLNTRTTYLAYC